VRGPKNFGGAEKIFRVAEAMIELRANSFQVWFSVLVSEPDGPPEPWRLGPSRLGRDAQQELAGQRAAQLTLQDAMWPEKLHAQVRDAPRALYGPQALQLWLAALRCEALQPWLPALRYGARQLWLPALRCEPLPQRALLERYEPRHELVRHSSLTQRRWWPDAQWRHGRECRDSRTRSFRDPARRL
jgi:hypothetical protein